MSCHRAYLVYGFNGRGVGGDSGITPGGGDTICGARGIGDVMLGSCSSCAGSVDGITGANGGGGGLAASKIAPVALSAW